MGCLLGQCHSFRLLQVKLPLLSLSERHTQEQIQIQYRMWLFRCHLGINVYEDMSNRQRNMLVAEKFPSFMLFLSLSMWFSQGIAVSVPRSRSRQGEGVRLRRQVAPCVCSECFAEALRRGEPAGDTHSSGTEKHTVACWEKIQDHQLIFIPCTSVRWPEY